MEKYFEKSGDCAYLIWTLVFLPLINDFFKYTANHK